MADGNTLFIIGESRTNSDNAITKTFGSFYLALEVNAETGEILDFSCTHTLDLTEQFLKRVFVGKNLEKDCENLAKEITRRYCGSSQKALLASLTDANKRYQVAKEKFNN